MSAPQTPKAPRTFIDQVAGVWHTSSEPVWIGAGMIGLFQAFMTYRLLDLRDAGGVLPTPWWMMLTAVSISSLLFRSSPPAWSCSRRASCWRGPTAITSFPC